MKKHSQRRNTSWLVLAIAFVATGVFTLNSDQRRSSTGAPRQSWTEDLAAGRADQLLARWVADYEQNDLYTRTPVYMGFSRAFSERFTKAKGQVEIDFRNGRVSVGVDGLDPLPEGATYEVWLVENGSGPENTAAIELGEDGDRFMKLGSLPATGRLVTDVKADHLASFEVDMAAVMRVTADQEPAFVIGGMQSIRFKVGRQASIRKGYSSGAFAAAGFPPTIAAVGPRPMLLRTVATVPASGQGNLERQIAQGRDLFFNGTFNGNGRTCATCHRANNELTIDIEFIASLPANDPLFVAEFPGTTLPPFDDLNPNKPAFEDPLLMRMRGLILENIDGFGLDANGNLLRPPVFRVPPSLFNLQFTAPYGYSACCNNLQDFAVGAVVQHFPKTLNRQSRGKNADFKLPSGSQAQAMEAFMLSNFSPTSRNFTTSGPNSLLSTPADPNATDILRAEVRGRGLVSSKGCTSCHGGTVFSGGNRNTGVESLEAIHPLSTPTVDDGDGFGQFQTPQLFGLRKVHFFHTGVIGSPLATQRDNLRAAVSFYVSPEFKASPTGGQVGAMSLAEIDDIAAFLEAISIP